MKFWSPTQLPLVLYLGTANALCNFRRALRTALMSVGEYLFRVERCDLQKFFRLPYDFHTLAKTSRLSFQFEEPQNKILI